MRLVRLLTSAHIAPLAILLAGLVGLDASTAS